MSPAARAQITSEPLSARYERLRERVLASSEGSGIPGLASVRRQGLWAWVELTRASDTPMPRPPTPPVHPPPHTAPVAHQAELVDVWVDLVLKRAIPKEAP